MTAFVSLYMSAKAIRYTLVLKVTKAAQIGASA